MGATLAAGTALAFFLLALLALVATGFDRAAAIAVVVGLIALSLSVALIGADRRGP